MLRTVLLALSLSMCPVGVCAQPPAPATAPAPPRDDYELFLENILNVPRGQRKVWNGKVYDGVFRPAGAAPATCPCPGGVCPLAPAPRPASAADQLRR